MIFPHVEHSLMEGGSPAGSPAHEEFLERVFDGVEDAVEEPVTSPDDETAEQTETGDEIDPETEEEVEEPDEEPEEEPEEEVEIDPLVQAKLDELDKLKKDLEEQKAGQDKYFTEQSERFKKLREDAGVEDIHKGDKAVKKELKGFGFDDEGKYIARNYREATDDQPGWLNPATLDKFVRKNALTKQGAQIIQDAAPVLNAIANDIRKEALEQVRAAVASIREDYDPVKDGYSNDKMEVVRTIKWKNSVSEFGLKHKPTPEQVEALRVELPNIWTTIDDADPVEIEKALRRIIHDPEILKKSATKPKKAKPKKAEPKAAPVGKAADLSKEEELLASMFD